MNERQGRGWAYLGALLGGAVSIAANVAHSYVPPEGAQADWSPNGGAVAGAVFWPVALFVAVEIFARIAWPAGRRWVALRFLGLLPVALVAAVVSYRHLSGLLGFYGEDGLTVVIGPLAVDGLMVMATGALIATGARRSAAVPLAEAGLEMVTPEQTPAAPSSPALVAEPVGVELVNVDQEQTEPLPMPEPVPPTKAATRRPARRQTAADRVARAAARTPTATPAQLAARLNLSERTVQRYMPRPADDTKTTAQRPSEQVNGHPVPALVTSERTDW